MKQKAGDKTNSQSTIFIGMALDMSWRLAIVVLVPIIGGFELDQRLNTSPLLMIIGFLLAMAGTGLVMWQTLQAANQLPVPKKGEALMIGALFTKLADSGPIVHVAPGGVGHIGGWVITNSILYGWICAVFLIVLFVWTARRVTVRPKGGFVQIVEIGVDFITNLVEGAFDNKEVGRKYVPYFVTLFFFILFNNWLGLLPIVGEGFRSGGLPLLRPFTADLDATFAMGLITMLLVYTASVRESGGVRKYLRHFFVGSPKNPLYFVIGLLEMLTDLFRVLSLSLRLFLNVTIGEIVIAVFSYLGHIAAPLTALPFTLVELFIGALQAYIFTILAVMYLAIAVNHAEEHAAEPDLTGNDVPETIKAEPARGSANG